MHLRDRIGVVVVAVLTAAVVAGSATAADVVRMSRTATWPKPSPDPTGLTFNGKSLLISDAEVEEYGGLFWRKRNLFVARKDGVLRTTRRLTKATSEPEGIAWFSRKKALYVADDDKRAIFRFGRGSDGRIGTRDDKVKKVVDTERWGSRDPEGLTIRTKRGKVVMLIWADAGEGDRTGSGDNRIYKLKRGRDHHFGTRDDSMSRFKTSVFGFTETEGVFYDRRTNDLFITSSKQCGILQTTLGGRLLRTIFTSTFCGRGNTTKGFSDLVIAPGTDGSPRRLYLLDHGQDDANPDGNNDGKLYQVRIGP
jgi:hypothetical protein